MIQAIKKPLSILLSVLMIVSVFAALPITASAATEVAQIGDTKYASLEDALTAISTVTTVYHNKSGLNIKHYKANGTITLLADCNGNGIVIESESNLTIDFNGKKYTVDGDLVGSNGTESLGFQLLKDSTVTFKNGTLYSEKAKMLVQNYSDLTLDNMTLTLNNPNYAYAYTLSNNNGDVVIDGTTINANPAGGFAFDVCRYSSYPSVNVTVKGGSTINGDVEVDASNGDAKNGFSLTLESGTMTGDIKPTNNAKAAIAATPDKATIVKDNNFKFYVAQIGDTGYADLQAALNAAQNGDEVVVLDNVALTGAHWFQVYRNVTINLNGKTVSSEDSVFALQDGANVTVKNGTMISTVANDYAIYVQPTSTFTLASDATIKAQSANGNGMIVKAGCTANIYGKIISKDYAIAGFGTAVVNVYDGATLTSDDAAAISGNGSGGNEGYTFNVYGGTLTSNNDVAIYHPNQGTLNITGGTITGKTAVYIKSGSTDVSTSGTSISGATIRGTGEKKEMVHSGNGCNATGDAIVIENCGYPGGAPAIGISGGTIISDKADPVGSYAYGKNTETGVAYEPITGFISGGTYNKAVPAALCNPAYVPVDNQDGTYGVAKTYVAQVGNIKYETLEAAFAAAQDGQTITLLADCAGNGIGVPQGKFTTGLTVDFAGYTYTVDGSILAGSPGTKTQAFQLLKDNTITFKNGKIYSEKAWMLVQNYSNLTLDNMELTLNKAGYNGAYTLSNNNGNTVIKDSTINANPTTGSFAFDVCRGGGSDSYPSVYVTVTGDSEINGNVELYAKNGDAKEGFGLTLTSGTMNGDIVLTAQAKAAMAATPDKVTVTKATTFDQAAPEGYVWVASETEGVQTIAKAVAQVGDTKYESFEKALAAISDVTVVHHTKSGLDITTYKADGTITLLADCAGNGIVINSGSNLTIDFNGHTYNVNGTPVGSDNTETIGFQLLKDSNITFKNGTIYGDSRDNTNRGAQKLIRLIQNYSNLTLDNMTLSLTGQYYDQSTIYNNNGNTVIKDSTINAPEFTWAGYDDPGDVGGYAMGVSRYASYPSVSVTVKGNSTIINGDVHLDASDNDAKGGLSLTLESGSLDGDIVLEDSAKAAIAKAPDKAKVTKKDTFDQASPEGYEWVSNGDGTSTLKRVFTGHSITLKGYIDLNFYMDPSIVGVGDTVTFTWADDQTDTYTIKATDFDDEKGYKATVRMPAAEMTYDVTATVNGNGKTDTFSVRKYCDLILADTNSSKALKDLVKAMLDYGAKAQTVFKVNTNDLANAGIGYTMPNETTENLIGLINEAISTATANNGKTATTLTKGVDYFYTSSLIFLSGNTLRLYYYAPANTEGFNGNKGKYYYVQKDEIKAAELDTLQTFTVNGKTVNYSALDYVKLLLANNAKGSAAYDLAAATYYYNAAANAYFGQ